MASCRPVSYAMKGEGDFLKCQRSFFICISFLGTCTRYDQGHPCLIDDQNCNNKNAKAESYCLALDIPIKIPEARRTLKTKL